MTVIAVIEAAALVATVYLFVHALREQSTQFMRERAELLTRIQRPELVPSRPTDDFVFPDVEPDELDLVGAITETAAE